MSASPCLFIPDDFEVWVFGDLHGDPAPALRALARAGLVDPGGHWAGGAGKALIFDGDLVDRGTNSKGAVILAQRLSSEASAAGSLAAAVGGNHEELVASVARANFDSTLVWFYHGGEALCRELDIALPHGNFSPRTATRLAEDLAGDAPELVAFCSDLPSWALWRDVAIVHAGLPMIGGLAALNAGYGRWDDSFRILPNLRHPALQPFTEIGIARVVVAHSPTPGRATLLANGAVLSLDANLGPTVPGQPSAAALARLAPTGRFSLDDVLIEPAR